jgi:hypothetical protein
MPLPPTPAGICFDVICCGCCLDCDDRRYVEDRSSCDDGGCTRMVVITALILLVANGVWTVFVRLVYDVGGMCPA